VDQRARRLVQRGARRHDPVGQAVAAKAGKAHEVDVLRIMAMAQVAHQAAKGGGGMGIVQRVQRIGSIRIHIHGLFGWLAFLGLSPGFAIAGRQAKNKAQAVSRRHKP
jgi:hypothetical protein